MELLRQGGHLHGQLAGRQLAATLPRGAIAWPAAGPARASRSRRRPRARRPSDDGSGTTVSSTSGSSIVRTAANRSLPRPVPSWTSSTWLTPTPAARSSATDRAWRSLILGMRLPPARSKYTSRLRLRMRTVSGCGCAVVEVDPVEGDLLDLLVGRIDVRGPQDQLLGLEVLGRVDDGEQRDCWSARSAAAPACRPSPRG